MGVQSRGGVCPWYRRAPSEFAAAGWYFQGLGTLEIFSRGSKWVLLPPADIEPRQELADCWAKGISWKIDAMLVPRAREGDGDFD